MIIKAAYEGTSRLGLFPCRARRRKLRRALDQRTLALFDFLRHPIIRVFACSGDGSVSPFAGKPCEKARQVALASPSEVDSPGSLRKNGAQLLNGNFGSSLC